MQNKLPEDPVRKLVEIMKLLRGPDGCPWDKLQTPETLKPYLLEEACEVLHSIETESPDQVRNELGDLLLQIVFLSNIYEEKKMFGIDDVAESISEKLIRRHPHVFGESNEQDLSRLDQQWESIKQEEKDEDLHSHVEGIPTNLPALLQAQKLSKKVAKVGFDWDSADRVMDKFEEEMNELKFAIKAGNNNEISSEFGDVLFTLVNLGRHLEVDCETALLEMLQRFKSRFQEMEDLISAADEEIGTLNIEQLETYWQEAKRINQQKS